MVFLAHCSQKKLVTYEKNLISLKCSETALIGWENNVKLLFHNLFNKNCCILFQESLL